MNTIQQHNDWADSMADWAVSNPAPRYEPQGRVEQSWPLRSGSPEWAVYEPEDDDTREEMSAWEAFLLMLAYIASGAFVGWCLWMLSGVVKEWLS